MSERFVWEKFSDVDINDSFFDSLKEDYPEFPEWFKAKSDKGESALVCNDPNGVVAFVYLKRENEEIELVDKTLPKKQRLKIGTLKLSERIRSQRLGEGSIGVALWYWQNIGYEEVYVTVFEKQKELIGLLTHFGFKKVGENTRGEGVYLKSKIMLEFSSPYKSFPYVSNSITAAGIIPIEEEYHDKLFPYSELYGNDRNVEEITAGNGITKVFVATPADECVYKEGMPVFIYRKHTGSGQKAFKSAVTSLCTVSRITVIKDKNSFNISFDEFKNLAGNKTVYPEEKLKEIYESKSNVVAIELVYNTYFGKGHNVNYATLANEGLFNDYPYKISYNRNEINRILELGGKNVQDIIVD